jgi:hypothetical protein
MMELLGQKKEVASEEYAHTIKQIGRIKSGYRELMQAGKGHSHPIEGRVRSRQDSEIRPTSEGYSRTIEGRAIESLGQQNQSSKRGALTSYRAHSEGVVITVK